MAKQLFRRGYARKMGRKRGVSNKNVMPGLDPGISLQSAQDCRVKPGNDASFDV
jgi:hypothetical protein